MYIQCHMIQIHPILSHNTIILLQIAALSSLEVGKLCKFFWPSYNAILKCSKNPQELYIAHYAQLYIMLTKPNSLRHEETWLHYR